MIKCPKCNYENEKDSAVCEACGADMTQIECTNQPQSEKSGKKAFAVIAIVLVAVFAATALIWFFVCGDKGKEVSGEVRTDSGVFSDMTLDATTDSGVTDENFEELNIEFEDEAIVKRDVEAAYVDSDNKLYYYNDTKGIRLLLSEKGVVDTEYPEYRGEVVYVTKDYKNIFYMENLDSACDYYCGNLCMRSVEEPDKEPIVIAENVCYYKVLENDTQVVFLKETIGELCEYDVTTGECNTITTTDDRADVMPADGEAFFYLTDRNLYKKEFGKESTLILDDVYRFTHKDGELYIERFIPADKEIKYADYVDFDVEKSEYQDEATYDQLKNDTVYVDGYEVYFYDDKNGLTKVSDVGSGDFDHYYSVDFSNVGKVKLSEISSIYDVQYYIRHNAHHTYYYRGADKDYPIDSSKNLRFKAVNGDGSKIAFAVYNNPSMHYVYNICDLFEVGISDGKPSEPVWVDGNVYDETCFYVGDKLIYSKNIDVETLATDYYCNDGDETKIICARAKEIKYHNGTFVYQKEYVYDRNTNKGMGEAFVINENGKKTVYNEYWVPNSFMLNNGGVVFIAQRDEESFGTLMLCRDGNVSELLEKTDTLESGVYDLSGASSCPDAIFYVDGTNLMMISDYAPKLVAENVVYVACDTLY